MLSVAQLCLLAIIATGHALKIKLLEPSVKTMWTTGADVEIFWKTEGGNDDSPIKSIELNLMQGRSKRPQLVDNIAFGVDWKHGDAFWTVDEKLQTGDDYFVQITSPEDKDFFYESEFFTIKNMPRGSKNKDKDQKQQGRTSAASNKLSPSHMAVLAAGFFAIFACL